MITIESNPMDTNVYEISINWKDLVNHMSEEVRNKFLSLSEKEQQSIIESHTKTVMDSISNQVEFAIKTTLETVPFLEI
jgi:hypothetical protein